MNKKKILQGNVMGKKISCRESIEKGKKFPAQQVARKRNSCWPEIIHPPPPPSKVKWSAPKEISTSHFFLIIR